jgi:serine/threonine-protein kinase RsbW
MRTAKRPSHPSDRPSRGRVQRQTFPADSRRLPEVCDWVRRAADDCGFDERTSYACQLAVCEAVENVIQHGYRHDAKRRFRLETRTSPGQLVVELVDDASPFDPTHFPTPDPHDPRIGGRGILMITRVMDDIVYERRKNQNVLRMTKNRAFTGV